MKTYGYANFHPYLGTEHTFQFFLDLQFGSGHEATKNRS